MKPCPHVRLFINYVLCQECNNYMQVCQEWNNCKIQRSLLPPASSTNQKKGNQPLRIFSFGSEFNRCLIAPLQCVHLKNTKSNVISAETKQTLYYQRKQYATTKCHHTLLCQIDESLFSKPKNIMQYNMQQPHVVLCCYAN